MTEGHARALAELVHHIRPKWDRDGIFWVVKRDTRSEYVVTMVALECAFDHAVRTPGMISRREPNLIDGQLQLSQTPTPAIPADQHAHDRCGRIHDPEQTSCKQPNPELAKAGAAAAREALRQTPTEWSPPDE